MSGKWNRIRWNRANADLANAPFKDIFATPRRITVSTSKPATRLIEYAQRLTRRENYELARRIQNGERVIVFHIDGDTVTLAEQREAVAA